MAISIDLNAVKSFTSEHLSTYKSINPKERYPHLFGEDLPKTLEVVDEAGLYDFDEVNWVDSVGLTNQKARAGGKNTEYKKIALSIELNGFKLDKPAIGIILEPNGKGKKPLNGRTRKSIITQNYKHMTNFIGTLYKVKDEYVNENGSYKPEAQSDISVFSVVANTDTDPAGLTTKDTIYHEVNHALEQEWIKSDFASIQARVNRLCGKGIFAERTRQDLALRIYNQYSPTDKILPWDVPNVKTWRKINNLLDVTWDKPKKIGNKIYNGIVYCVISSETLEKSVGTVARIAKENPNHQIRVIPHTGVLRGFDVEDNFLSKIDNFKKAWQTHLDNYEFAYFNDKPAQTGQECRVWLYGCLPAIQACHDLTKIIRFVDINDDVDSEDYNPHGLEQNGEAIMHSRNLMLLAQQAAA